LGPGADASARLPPQSASALVSLPPNTLLQVKSSFSLFTATPMNVPQNAITLEPPPVTSNIKAQILSGADIDLSSLPTLLPISESNRQVDCGDFSVTLKN